MTIALPFILAHAAGHDEAGEAIGPQSWHELWHTWGLEPYVWLGLVLTAWLYARGLRRMWREPGAGHGVKTWEAWCYAAGWLSLFIALAAFIGGEVGYYIGHKGGPAVFERKESGLFSRKK